MQVQNNQMGILYLVLWNYCDSRSDIEIYENMCVMLFLLHSIAVLCLQL